MLEVYGILYNGMSGGPVLNGSGKIVGMLSGSLINGSSYGWAIPAELIAKFVAAAGGDKPPPWPAIPFLVHGRSLEVFATKNLSVDDALGSYLRDIDDLVAANRDINMKAGALTVMLELTTAAVQGAISTWPKSRKDDAGNHDEYIIQAGSDLLLMHPYLEDLSAALSRRYNAKGHLRLATNTLLQLVKRQDLDNASLTDINNGIQDIVSKHQPVAVNIYERKEAIDGNSLLEALNPTSTV